MIWIKSTRLRLIGLLILQSPIIMTQIWWGTWVFPQNFDDNQDIRLEWNPESQNKTKKPFTLYLITPSSRPSYLCRSIFHVMRLQQCFDVHWVIVHHSPDARLFKAPLFRNVFPWITELSAFNSMSRNGNHQRNVGIDYALNMSQSDLDLLNFLDDDNVLPSDSCPLEELYNISAKKVITAIQNKFGRLYTKPRRYHVNGLLRTDTSAWFVPVRILREYNDTTFWLLDRYDADSALFTKLGRIGPYSIKGQEDNIAVLQSYNFTYNELLFQQGSLPWQLWNAEWLRRSLGVYRRQVQMMEDIRHGLPQEHKMNQSEISLHDYVHILYNVREAVRAGEATYLEIGVGKGATSIFMSRHELKTNVIGIDSFVIPNQLAEAEVYRNALKGQGSIDWIKGDPTSSVPALKGLLRNRPVLILFISGDHRLTRTNFELYEPFVAAGGFIVFDNFMDTQNSPHVRETIMHLIQEKKISMEKYTIIGSVNNFARAGPIGQQDKFYYDWQKVSSNEFIIQKK